MRHFINPVQKKIFLEDIASGRSADFSYGRIAVLDEKEPDPFWTYERWVRICEPLGMNIEEVLKGVTFQRAVNEAVKAAIGGM
ncbi:MAG: hypothetical protein IJW05_12155 [Lentisphaeria bacterium]|nr:hypothetical protein [Lentisphaeria bacterium]